MMVNVGSFGSMLTLFSSIAHLARSNWVSWLVGRLFSCELTAAGWGGKVGWASLMRPTISSGEYMFCSEIVVVPFAPVMKFGMQMIVA